MSYLMIILFCFSKKEQNDDKYFILIEKISYQIKISKA